MNQALMTVNLLKRLESSVQSFRLTLQSLRANNEATLAKLAAFNQSGGKTTALTDTISDLDDFELIAFLVIQAADGAEHARGLVV